MGGLSLTEELETARRALDAGDPKHALRHLAGAFERDAFDERVTAALDEVAQKTDVLANAPENDGFLGTIVLRAHALRRAGRASEGISLLAQVTEQFPNRHYETLCAAWVLAEAAAGRALAADTRLQLARLLSLVARPTVGLHRLREGEQATLTGFFELAEALAGLPPAETHGTEGGLLRRAGRFEAARRALEAGVQAGNRSERTQWALTLRTMGRAAEAEALFAELEAAHPGDDTLTVERARCLFVMGEAARAADTLERLAPNDDVERRAMVALYRSPPEGDRLDQLDAIRRRSLAPSLDSPRDATFNIFGGNAEKLRPGTGKITISISGWESPSNRLLAGLYGGIEELAAVPMTMNPVGALNRDPAVARRSAHRALWRDQQGVLVQAVEAPPAELRGAIGRLGASMTDFEALWPKAAALAATLAPQAADGVMATLVHPPRDAEWLASLPSGLYRTQVAAACVLANLRLPWSEKRARFEALLFGPVDWSSGAAVVALGELSRRDAEVSRDAAALLAEVVEDLIRHSCEPRFEPLAHALSSSPLTPVATLEVLKAYQREVFSEEPAPAPAPAAPPVRPEPTGPVAAPPSAPVPAWLWVVGVVAALVLYQLLR